MGNMLKSICLVDEKNKKTSWTIPRNIKVAVEETGLYYVST